MTTKLITVGFFLHLLFCYNVSVQAQCIADAGSDRIICAEDLNDGVKIGGNPTATGGTAPYSYRWYSKLTIDGVHFPASGALNDTTLANPSLKSVLGWYHLEVTDANQLTCYDSVGIGISYFEIDLEEKEAEINLGDSLRLRTSVSGGWPPYTYSWSPGNNLEDSTNVNTWAKPRKYTNYELTITDSAGCTMQDFYKVKVKNSYISDQVDESSKMLYPNPNTGVSLLTIPPAYLNGTYEFSDLSGKTLKNGGLTSTNQPLDLRSMHYGIYILTIQKGRLQHSMRVIVQQ